MQGQPRCSSAVVMSAVEWKESFLTSAAQEGVPPLEVDELLYNGASKPPETDSARCGKLVQEAELRAEHQAAARTTMLDLARALDEANAQRRALRMTLDKEQTDNAMLRSRCSRLEDELDAAQAAEEQMKADKLLKKVYESGNKVFINMMLEKSRDVYSSDLFKPDSASEGPEAESSGAGRRPASLFDLVQGGSKGDRVTFEWVWKLWVREVELTKKRLAEEAAERERQRLEEERKRKIQEEIEARVGEVRKQMDALQMRLDAALEINRNNQKREQEIVKHWEEKLAEANERNRALQDSVDHLSATLTMKQAALDEAHAQVEKSLKAEQEAQEALRRCERERAMDIKKHEDQMRALNAEMQQAVLLARHMKEVMIRAKRDAASSVSPAMFAELMDSLERMRENLAAMTRNYEHEKDNSAEIQRQLDKNQRRLELERQFLPLLRQVRGPVGPKNSMLDAAPRRKDNWNKGGDLLMPVEPLAGDFSSPKHLRTSHSHPVLVGGKGGPLGGGF